MIARVFLQEHLGRRPALGISLVVVGGVVLAGAKGGGFAARAVLVAAAGLCWGIDNAVTASLDSYTPARITLATTSTTATSTDRDALGTTSPATMSCPYRRIAGGGMTRSREVGEVEAEP